MNNPDIWNMIRGTKPKVNVKAIHEVAERVVHSEPLPESFKQRVLNELLLK